MTEFVVKCERLDHQGRGIVKINGKTTFVDNLLPGEEAIIKIIDDKKKFSVGKIKKLNTESLDRVKPKCPYLNCGCTLKHLKYEKQLEYKEEKVKDILKRYGDINSDIKPIVYSQSVNGYRNKITLKVDDYVGYYHNHSNDFIMINRCELVSEKVNELIKIINNLNLTKVKEIVIKEFDGLMLYIKGDMDVKPLYSYVDSIYLNDEFVYGKEYLTTKLNDLKFIVSKEAFFQVNKNTTEKLYQKAIEYCGKDLNKNVLDLYCGTGTISLLLSKFKNVTGIEINKEAIKCANENKKLNNIDNVNFICGDVSEKIENFKNIDIIVVDPPRSGLTEKAIKDIIKINPQTMVYISCDPMTLARDLKILNQNYNILEVTPVDMFPNTYHVENVAKLERR